MKKIRTLDNQPRHPVSDLPAETSATMLCNPKSRMTGAVRRALMASRQIVVDFPRAEAKPQEVRITARLAALPLEKLGRRLHQSARRASTAKHLLAKTRRPVLRAAMRAEQDKQLETFQLVRAEIQKRRGGPFDRVTPTQPNSDNNVHGPTS